MKPDTETSNIKLDQLPVQKGQTIENSRNIINPETSILGSIEKGPQKVEPASIVADIGSITALPTPVSATVTDDDTATSGAPQIAKDDDLIEKEWVDKAKQIVNQTKNDPHQRETGVSKLKVDYLKKRFGRELGAAE